MVLYDSQNLRVDFRFSYSTFKRFGFQQCFTNEEATSLISIIMVEAYSLTERCLVLFLVARY